MLEGARTGEATTALAAVSLGASSSVWPELSRQIRVIDDRRSDSRWRGWLPAGALAAACLAIVVITSDLMDEPQATARTAPPGSAVPSWPVVLPSTGGSPFVSGSAAGVPHERIDTSDPESRPGRRPIRQRVLEDGSLRSF